MRTILRSLPRFKVVAAIDEGRGIGMRGDLPWHLPADLEHFATTTTRAHGPQQNAVLMGRLTCETIPEKFWPLKGRLNAVITRNRKWSIDSARVFANLEEALSKMSDTSESLYVVGGGQIYSLALKLEACEELILTRVERRFDCDVFFPQFETRYHLAENLGCGEHEGLSYRFERWLRNK